jgi:hypothetical protein
MSAWPERTLNSLREIQQLAVDIGARWPNSDRCMFRGQSSADWTLEPSLARELAGSRTDWFQVLKLEYEMVKRFRQEAHRALSQSMLPAKDYILDWWPIMRHHGAPTRLLDWSLSPYVALYFAVEQRWDEDGALWWFNAATCENLMVRTFGVTYKEMERNLFESQGGEAFMQSSPPSMLFSFELKRTIERIGNQQGHFTVCLDPRADHAEVLQELASYSGGPYCGKLIVPKVLKPEILRDLQLMNVTGKSMFPGLDGLGRTLTELTKLSVRYGVP